MSIPEPLAAAAMLGATRAGLPSSGALPDALAWVHAGLAGRPPEKSLLVLVGAAALYDAAGRVPDRAPGNEWRLPAYRPENDRPPCSPAAAHILERMLNQQDAAFFPEFLVLLDIANRRAPDALLPHLLAHGVKITRLRPLLLPVAGERGRWLGAINPAWRYATVDAGDQRSLRGAWDADPAGRATLATMARRHDPAAARHLIESTWRNEPENARRELLAVLESGLSMADEPFLERVLDDRDAMVRRKAAELLANLPESRLVGRLTAAAGAILVQKGDGLFPSFPGEITETMMRDGVVRNQHPQRGTGTRTASDWSRLLIQTVGAIPLAHWESRFAMEPAGIVAAALAGKWPRTLMTAFATAAMRQSDAAWIDALLAGDKYSERTGMLLQALEPAECYKRLAQRLAAGDDAGVVVFLRRWLKDWDEDSARSIIDFLGRHAEVDPDTSLSPGLRFLSRQFAHHCPTSLVDYATQAFGERRTNKAWQASLANVIATLAFRAEMRAAVAE